MPPPPAAPSLLAAGIDENPLELQVRKRMRDLMSSPLGERKHALKMLMLEFHPDKNPNPDAKEAFQFINASRAWFLLDTDLVDEAALQKAAARKRKAEAERREKAEWQAENAAKVAMRKSMLELERQKQEQRAEAERRFRIARRERAAQEAERFAGELAEAMQTVRAEKLKRDAVEMEELKARADKLKKELDEADMEARILRREKLLPTKVQASSDLGASFPTDEHGGRTVDGCSSPVEILEWLHSLLPFGTSPVVHKETLKDKLMAAKLEADRKLNARFSTPVDAGCALRHG